MSPVLLLGTAWNKQKLKNPYLQLACQERLYLKMYKTVLEKVYLSFCGISREPRQTLRGRAPQVALLLVRNQTACVKIGRPHELHC